MNEENARQMPSGAACPACTRSALNSFYRLESIPVNSCLLLPSAEEAASFPRANLELAVCEYCGFITNVAFDPGRVIYTQAYEDQQSYSATFNTFARKLAERLIEDFHLFNKRIVEVGCGKGDFLKLLCTMGANQGTGIDPSISPRQLDGAVAGTVEWLAEPLGLAHGNIESDFYCCRHTLEHIHDVRRFMLQFRQVIGKREAPLFLEVPDTHRLLVNAAFEDIYYEHCSYFTRTSLTRLLETAGFKVTRLYRDFADQYLMGEALPGNHPSDKSPPPDRGVEETLAQVEQFESAVEQKKRHWTDLFAKHRDGPVALWGSGSKCVSLLSTIRPEVENLFVVDINPHRHGKYLPGSGLKIQSPDTLGCVKPHLVVAMNSIYLSEIQEQLSMLDVRANLHGL